MRQSRLWQIMLLAVKRAPMPSVSRMPMLCSKGRWCMFEMFLNAWWNSMAIKPVLKMGDPRLLEVAQKVKNFGTPALHALIQDLRDTMESLDGAGLAAPQIGVGLQVVIFGVKHNP